ncbi:hypothetical protein Taro_022602 [Colocasia esculenta]|uniref:Apyrase 7 n=1 Tax=Colocasia esculenta TaxID=4460 RepID=A0A843V5T7_COLES|nr:hypothetical protein [Colocasia esculenta]
MGGDSFGMRLNRIAVAFSTARDRIMLPASPARASDSIPSGGPGHGRPGVQKGNMRLSASLQDFSTYTRLDPEGGGSVQFEIEGPYAHPQTARALLRESGGSSFSKEKPFSESHSTRKRWMRIVACVLCLFLFLSLLFVCAVRFSRYWSQKSSRYYVILDCGSTGTRVYVYECSLDHNKAIAHLPISLKSLPEGLKKISSSQTGRAYQRMETEPGFDKLVRNESGLRAAIKPLIRWAEKQIPKNAHKSTSLFVYATAGVRRLPEPDSEWLLSKAWSILKSSSFLCQKDWVKIISGMEEAYYGWIALNYQMGTMGSIPPKETFGALDLGYGLNDAFGKSVVHLLKRQPSINLDDLKNGKKELKHPCLHRGYKEQYMCSHCALSGQEGSPLVSGKHSGRGQAGIPVTLVGAPVWEECSALARTTVNLSEWSNLTPGIDCEIRPCALSDSLPRPHGQFYAMSGFFVLPAVESYKFRLTSVEELSSGHHLGVDYISSTPKIHTRVPKLSTSLSLSLLLVTAKPPALSGDPAKQTLPLL